MREASHPTPTIGPAADWPSSARLMRTGYWTAWLTTTSRTSSPRSSATATCAGSRRRSTRTWRSPRSSTGCVRGRRPGAAVRERRRLGDMPLAMNVFGTDRRMAKALGVDDLDEIGERIGELLKPELPHGFGGMRDALGKVGAAARRAAEEGASTRAVPGGRAPAATTSTWTCCPACRPGPRTAASSSTSGLTHTKHPETGAAQPRPVPAAAARHAHGRHALADPQGLHRPPRGRRAARRAAAGRDRVRLPDPAVTYAATAPLPGDIDEYLFAGFLRGERVEMVDCLTVPLQVPAARAGRARGLARAGRAAARRGRSATTPASTRRSSRSRR